MGTETVNFGYVMVVLDLEPHLQREAQAYRESGRLISAQECERVLRAISPPGLRMPYERALSAIEWWVQFELNTALFRGEYEAAAALDRIATGIARREFLPAPLRNG